jgi:hypothetical protein
MDLTSVQLCEFSKRLKLDIDCVFLGDEAGQLGLGHATLALQSLRARGRVIIVGDSGSLAPILADQYPKARATVTRVHP